MNKNYSQLYKDEIFFDLKKELKYQNDHLVPRLSKIVINMGVGDAVKDSKVIKNAVSDLTLISAQKPVIIKAKKSESAFKLREGMEIGCKVTLRKSKMYDFLERFVKIALPRVRDFRGFSEKNFDGRGNFSFGIKEQIIFMEIDYDKIDKIRGMDITFVTTSNVDKDSKLLLSKFKMPFIELN